MPPLLPPVFSHRPLKRGLRVVTTRCSSAADCWMLSLDQSAGEGVEVAKKRCSIVIWLAARIRVGSPCPGFGEML